MKNWIYSNNKENSTRFLLGCREKPEGPLLITIGINPSTAEPDKLDPTVTIVKNRALDLGYAGWCTINVYPQRATDPNHMNKELNLSIHKKNMNELSSFFLDLTNSQESIHIWAAWGSLITKRPYLRDCLAELVKTVAPFSPHWYTMGVKTKAGHPHHPLYLKKGLPQDDFDINRYLDYSLS